MWDWIAKLNELNSQNISLAIVTITDTGGSTPRSSGAKMIVLTNREIFGTVGGGQFEKQVIDQAIDCIQNGSCGKFTFNLGQKSGQCCGGVMEVFIETLVKKNHLIVFGAGHVAKAVLETLKETPFTVSILDLYDSQWTNSFKNIYDKTNNNYFVIMTHSHQLDEEILTSLIDLDYKYLGLIGSETKWQRFKSRLRANGITEGQLQKVKCPIGIKLLGKAPKEVAISLAAELLDLYYHE
jgi:xanthine dehydrogenase accessory factor